MPTMTRSTSGRTSTEYTNGRLVVDEDMAFDLLELLEHRRVTLLLIRADLRDEGLTSAADHITKRLGRLRRIAKRIERLCEEKDWGTYTDRTIQDDAEEA